MRGVATFLFHLGQRLAQTDTKALYALAENYAELRRIDEALAALEKCIQVREERMMWLKVRAAFCPAKRQCPL
jgi:Flp pilus assembly protein TadD